MFQLGATPQLEWWNAGIVEKWVPGYCLVDELTIFVLKIKLKIKIDHIL